MTQEEFNNGILGLQPELKRYARSLVKGKEDIDDLLQDTYLKALRYKSEFRDNTNLRAWLYTILKNTFVNGYRSKKMHGELVDVTPDLHFINTVGNKGDISPESHYQEKELWSLIEGLPVNLRESFKMHIEGYKYEEIAEKLGVLLGTIKSRIFLARKRLMDGINNNKFVNMKTGDFGYDEVVKFRSVSARLIEEKTMNKNQISIKSGISWPTLKRHWIFQWKI
jgi:RNA polymerase sigma-70 factor, ECF subfamily